MAIINTRVAGIPCQARTTYYDYAPRGRGSPHLYASPEDYYGYEDIEFELLDRKGYKAAWLERKMTKADKTRIENEISRHIADQSDY